MMTFKIENELFKPHLLRYQAFCVNCLFGAQHPIASFIDIKLT